MLLLLAAPAFAQTPAVPPAAPALPTVTLDGALSGPLQRPHLQPAHIVYGGEVTFDADQADADLKAKRYTLSGQVRLHETDTTLRAGEVTFDGGAAQSATATDALLTRGVFSVRAPEIDGTPALIVAHDANLTTVPNGGPADVSVRAQTITLDQKTHQGVLRNATLYLFGTRLLTVPRVRFHTGNAGAGAQRQVTIPIFGVSARYGTYVAVGSGLRVGALPVQYHVLLPSRQSVEATVTSRQTLYRLRPPAPPPAAAPTGPVTLLARIRAFSTLAPGPLPQGDPLLFHDFLPEPNPIRLWDAPARGGLDLFEDLSVHVAMSGRRRDDLYVSRLPEVTASGQIPLTRIPAAPVDGDPAAFRAALRHVVLYADAQETIGNYREQPTNTRARREQTQIGLEARPLLIAPNTVLLPRLSVSTSGYSGSRTAYRYNQLAVAVNHYFSDLTAVGIQFLGSNTGGDSPFNFDVLDTTRELDVRLQLGNRRLVTAGRVRYDLSHSGVIDYQLAVGPALRGFTPVFSYNFRTRSLGLGIEVKGLTF